MDGSIIETQVYLDKEYYPIATTRVLNAIAIMREISSSIHLPAVTRIYESLKASPYRKSIEVAEVGINLLFIEYHQYFHTAAK